MAIGTRNVSVEQHDIVGGGAVAINALHPVVSGDATHADAAFCARWGIAPDSDMSSPPVTFSAIRRAVDPTATSLNMELMSRFFPPGSLRPGYFELRVATTEFTVWVRRETRLCDVLGVVRRELLKGDGWPVLRRLCYGGMEEGGVWSEEMWEEVKREGRGRREGVVEVELVF